MAGRNGPRSRRGDLWSLGVVVFAGVVWAGSAPDSPLGALADGLAEILDARLAGQALIAFAGLIALWYFVLRWSVRWGWHALANRVGVDAPQPVGKARVIDGDTIQDMANGVRYRLANIDAPETGEGARCAAERLAGECAGRVAHNLVRLAKRVEVRRTWRWDRFGRRVAFVLVDGADLGETLMAHGLARPWRGRRVRWCGPGGGMEKMARPSERMVVCRPCGARRGWF